MRNKLHHRYFRIIKPISFTAYLIAMLLAIIASSCNKLNTIPVIEYDEVDGLSNAGTLLLGSDYEVNNGTLRFKNSETFIADIEKILNMSESELNKWESSIGFKSLRTIINEANNEFGNLKTESELALWKEKYKNVVELRDSSVTELIKDRKAQVLSNRSGEYQIESAIIKSYEDRVITIMDGDRNKLAKAALLKDSQLEKGIIVEMKGNENLILPNQLPDQFCSGGRHLNSKLEISKRRVYLTYDIDMDCTPTVNHFCKTVIRVRIYGQKKSLFGWNKYKSQYYADNLRFSINDNGDIYPMDHAVYSYASTSDEYEGGININLGVGTLYVDQYSMPFSFTGAMGRARSRGSSNQYVVICCGNTFPFVNCPSASD